MSGPIRIPDRGYARPEARAGDLRLDGNEGAPAPVALLRDLADLDPAVLRDYPTARGLEADLGESLGVEAARVLVTAGADDALDRLFRAYGSQRRVVLTAPTFEMMMRFADTVGADVVRVPWDRDFPTEAFAAASADASLAVVVSPNNPTGATLDAGDLDAIAAACPGTVVLDQVYVEYGGPDLTAAALARSNVVITRTFSKAWGLAGCRVGYLLGAPERVEALRRIGSPYPVAGPSLWVARRRLATGRDDLVAHVATVRRHRERLASLLEELGVPADPSEGNFLFVRCGRRLEAVRGILAWCGIRVRHFPHRAEIADGLRLSIPIDTPSLERLEEGLRLALAPQALLFDLDGVLADVGGSYRECIRSTCADYGVTVSDADIQDAKDAGDANNDWVVTQRLLAARGILADLDEVTGRFQARYLGPDGVGGLRESEIPIVEPSRLAVITAGRPSAIVTGRPRAEADWFLRRAGFDGFAAVIGLEDAPLKPDPAPVRLALDALGATRAWMVGDTPDDIRAAAAAGVVPLGILAPGATDPTPLREAGAAAVLRDLRDLEDWL